MAKRDAMNLRFAGTGCVCRKQRASDMGPMRNLAGLLSAFIAMQSSAASATELSRFCDVVTAHSEAALTTFINQNRIPEKTIADALAVDDAKQYISKSAWESAKKDDIDELTSGNGLHDSLVHVSRAPLFSGEPDAWLITVWVGSLNSPKIWVFHSAPDGKKADRYVDQLGEEGSGPFEAVYVRLDGQPVAIEVTRNEAGDFYYVFVFGQLFPVCHGHLWGK